MRTVRDTVLVAEHRLDMRLAREVAEACEQVHADYVPWRELARLERGGPPLLVVAGLPTGERHIAPDLMDVCTRTYPGLPVLLLCEDQLVQPTVTLRDGRVVMVGPPLTRQRIQSRLQLIRHERRHAESSGGPATPDAGQVVWTRERQRSDLWVAALGCRSPMAPATEPHRLPFVAYATSQLTGVLPSGPGRMPADTELQRVVALFDQAPMPPASRLLDALDATIGNLTGVVHLDTACEQWTFYWPRRDYPLWLFSSERLPQWWDLGQALARDPLHVCRAFTGDLIVAMTTRPPLLGDNGEDEVHELSNVMDEGGPALLEMLEGRLSMAPLAFAGMIVEAH